MESNKKTYQKRWFKWVVAAALLALLLVGGRIFLKSDFLFDKVQDFAVERVNDQLNGSVAIESIRGDLLSGFVVNSLQLHDDTEARIASIDSVKIEYRLRSLVRSPHQIDDFSLYGAHINIEQFEDSTWNVLNLLPEREAPDEEEPSEFYWLAEQIGINDLNVDIRSDHMLPDGFLNIINLDASMSAGMKETGFYGKLSSLEFNLQEARLPEPIEVYLAASGSEERFTLESMLINTGRTVLSSSAEYNESGELDSHIQMSPLSWADVLLYAEDAPLQQNLDITIGAEGSLKDLAIYFSATANGLENLDTQFRLSLEDVPTIHEMDIRFDGVDLPLLTGLEELPVFESLRLHGSGSVDLQDPEMAGWQGGVTLSGVDYDLYRLDRINLDVMLENGNLDVAGQVNHRQEQIDLTASVRNLFDELPAWQTEISTDNLNLATWLNDEDLASNLNISIALDGSGFDPELLRSHANITISDSRFGDQAFREVYFTGTVNPEELEGLLRARIDRSVLETRFTASDWLQIPSYQFVLEMREFNAAEIDGLEFFPTYLNGTLEGEGSGIDPEQLSMLATAAFDSSIVNGEQIETLKADFRIQDQFIFIDDGLLESSIADAAFSLRQHLLEITNTQNYLHFDAALKDLQPLAPLAGFEHLRSEGTLRGSLASNDLEQLEFNGSLNLEHVEADTLFAAEKIDGLFSALLLDEPEIKLNLDFYEPKVNGTGVQDVQFSANANIREFETTGSVEFCIFNGNQSSLTHTGDFWVDSTRVSLLTQSLLFETEARELMLDSPFEISYADQILRVDTLTISSEQDDAWMTLWAPHVDSLKQHAGIDARNLNLGILQETIMEESFFEGVLSGGIEMLNSPDSLEVFATGKLSNLRFEEGEMDSLKFSADLKDEWLNTQFESWHQGSQLADASIRVPFIPKDPQLFDEQFFERSIEGRLDLFESSLQYWLSFTPDGAPEQTAGNISLHADLSGIAGSPDLNGRLTLREGLFSGISIDSVGMDITYLHNQECIELHGSAIKDNQTILGFDAQVPFFVDLRSADLSVLSEEDSLIVNLNTDNFDLAMLNSYVDRDVIRQISGRLEGDLSLVGTLNNLETRGRMQLTRGTMRIMEAGITITEIASEIRFEPDRVNLQQFTMRSGPGRLQAVGNVELENLTPGNIDLQVTANQFRAFNTSDMNAILNLRSRLTGTASEPTLTGQLTLLNGFVNLQNFGDRAVEDVVLEDEEEAKSIEFFEALAIEFGVNFSRQFFIRNRQYLDMEIELGGEVDLIKERYEDMQMFGTLEGVRGYARPLGKNFMLDEALVSFAGPIDNPELNIRTIHEPPQSPGVQIFYIIEGTLDNPSFRFDSDPDLELQDIISYTLFGKPFYELESWEQVVAGSGSSPTAADVALDVLLDRVEMLASQRLGIDVVQIDNTRSGSGNTTSIKTGWYLNQRTFFAILNEVGGQRPKTLFMLEYLLQENLELIITQGDDSREGIDLRWRHDY